MEKEDEEWDEEEERRGCICMMSVCQVAVSQTAVTPSLTACMVV